MNKYLLHTFIEKHSAENGHWDAIAQGNLRINYKDLNELANQLAHLLQQKKVNKGDLIGVLMSNSIEYLVCLFAIMKNGCIAVPLEANYPKNRLKSIIAEIKPKIVFSTEENNNLLNCLRGDYVKDSIILGYSEEGLKLRDNDRLVDIESLSIENLSVDIDGKDSCYLLFTSGSTNKPKGIEGIHKSLSHFIHWEASMLKLDHTANVSQLAPVSFDVSLRDIFLPILVGGTICIPPGQLKFQIDRFIQWIQSSEIKIIHCVPSYFRLLIKALEDDKFLIPCLSTLKSILIAGEPLYGRDVNNWFDLLGDQIQLVNLYGPSETTLAKFFYQVPFQNYASNQIIHLGKPISHTSALLISNGRMCSEGQKAEILIKTPFRTKGYYNDDELNKNKFIQNPMHNDFVDIVFRTGDIGSFDADGNINFHGRTDDVVKYNGNRIELPEIQNVALKADDIDLAIAQIHSQRGKEQKLVLYYKSKSDLDQSNVLKQLFNANLPLYMHPALFVAMEEVPRLPNGKVNKKELSSIPLPSHSVGEEVIDELEMEIAEIWRKLLDVPSVTREQSFFQLGGTSLKAIQMISQIYKKKKVLLNLKGIFNQPTIAGIKELILAEAAPDNNITDKTEELDEASDRKLFTQAQLTHWIGGERESVDFNMPYIYSVTGNLDVSFLEDAINKVTDSYNFFQQNSGDKNLPYFQSSLDLINMEGSESQAVADYMAEYRGTPFREGDPVIKFKVVRLGEKSHLFALLTHLTKMDGTSVHLIFKEIRKAYLTLQKKEGYEANSKLVSLKEIVNASDLSNKEHQEFWEKRFQWFKNSERLTPSETFDSSLLKHRQFVIKSEELEQLNAFAQHYNTSLQILLTAIFEQVLDKSFDGSRMIYHNVISSRHLYEQSVLGNTLYFIPFRTIRMSTLQNQLKNVQDNLFATLERLPIDLNANKYGRPYIVLNMVDVGTVSEETLGGSNQNGLSIENYPHYQVPGRFPISITVSIHPEKVFIDISALEELVNHVENAEKTIKEIFEDFLLKLN
ncbi:AMP-binding protein [Croceitalea marina]|uniref:AMP-binding protein n=1 Tax=Croceitalea marina TaxID=1775166 RepID=A0ABW5MUT2_9FLAO